MIDLSDIGGLTLNELTETLAEVSGKRCVLRRGDDWIAVVAVDADAHQLGEYLDTLDDADDVMDGTFE